MCAKVGRFSSENEHRTMTVVYSIIVHGFLLRNNSCCSHYFSVRCSFIQHDTKDVSHISSLQLVPTYKPDNCKHSGTSQHQFHEHIKILLCIIIPYWDCTITVPYYIISNDTWNYPITKYNGENLCLAYMHLKLDKLENYYGMTVAVMQLCKLLVLETQWKSNMSSSSTGIF